MNKKCLNSPRVVPVYVTLQIAHTYSTRKCVGGGRKERVRARKEEDSAQAFPLPSLPRSGDACVGPSVGWGELSRNRQLTLPKREADNEPRQHGGGDDGEGRMWTDGRSHTRSPDSILFIGYGISSCSKVELQTFVRTILTQGLGAKNAAFGE